MVDATKNEWLARANGIKHAINRKVTNLVLNINLLEHSNIMDQVPEYCGPVPEYSGQHKITDKTLTDRIHTILTVTNFKKRYRCI